MIQWRAFNRINPAPTSPDWTQDISLRAAATQALLARLIWNLLSNAVRYTDVGGSARCTRAGFEVRIDYGANLLRAHTRAA